jgi:hypothetical protein
LTQHFVVPKAENDESLLFQPSVASTVACFSVVVLSAVDFYGDSLFHANEIHNVWANRSLSAKSVAAELLQPKMLPKKFLSIRGVLPEFSGSCYRALLHAPILAFPRRHGGRNNAGGSK